MGHEPWCIIQAKYGTLKVKKVYEVNKWLCLRLKGRCKESQLQKRMMGNCATFNFANRPGTSIINKLVCAQSDHTYTQESWFVLVLLTY